MTPQQYNEAKAILAGVPDGATHVDSEHTYWKMEFGVDSEYFDIEWTSKADYIEHGWKKGSPDCDGYRSLSDIKMLVEMHEREQKAVAIIRSMIKCTISCDGVLLADVDEYNRLINHLNNESPEKECQHKFVSARNQVITSGLICAECGMIAPEDKDNEHI